MEARYAHSTGHQPMISMRNVVVTGGNFTQHIAGQERKRPFEILQENVAHTAFHNSGARFDHPKCHPNTRLAVLQKIMDWMYRKDWESWYCYIMWLTGAAGAGKSAIAQSVIELCLAEGLIIASFFFFRSDSTRNHGKSFVATLAYQIFSEVPSTQDDMLLAIHKDPLIFTRSLSHQFDTLVIQPLRKVYAPLDTLEKKWRRLIAIDGLDECLDRDTQKEILTMLRNAIRKYELPIIFLVASRPEHDISTVFSSKPMDVVYFRLYLDEKFSPDDDVRRFLRDGFEEMKTTHPFKAYIPASWPSEETLEEIVRKSSGQFIYAATVFRYCKSTRHRPDQRLDIVNNLRPAHGELPFTQLDALYTMILDSAADKARVLYLLSILSHQIFKGVGVLDIASFMSLEPGELEILVCDLGAVVSIKKISSFWSDKDVEVVNILHKSLHDFLLDPVRSRDYFIDINTYRSEHVANIIQSVIKGPQIFDIYDFKDFITKEFPLCQSSNSLINSAEKFLFVDLILHEMETDKKNGDYYPMNVRGFVFWHWLPFCARMAPLDKRWAVIEKQHQEYTERVFSNQLPYYYEDNRGILFLCVACHLGSDMCVPIICGNLRSSDWSPLYDEHALYLVESFAPENEKAHHLRHFVRFLQHPDQSDSYHIGPSAYARAVLYCLNILEDLHLGSGDEDELLNILTIDNGKWTLHTTFELDDIVRDDFLLLGYTIFFLPRAGFSEALVQKCENACFLVDEITTIFPTRRALVRQEMKHYLERVRSSGPGSLQ